MGIAKVKSAYNSLIIGATGLQCEIMGYKSSDAVRFDFGPLLQSLTRITKVKSTTYYWSYRFAMSNQPIGNHGLGIFSLALFDRFAMFRDTPRAHS